MKVMLFVGNHIRHLYFLNRILKEIEVAGIVIEQREEFIPNPPEGIDEVDKNNFIKHFSNRNFAEVKYLSNNFSIENLNVPFRLVDYIGLNDSENINFVDSIKPDIVFVFGTGLIKKPLLSKLPKYLINLHLGLSPYYRGSATLFWPFYNLEPQFAGSTFHIINEKIDAGDIVSHVVPTLAYGDCIHDVAAKTVKNASEIALKILDFFKKEKYLNTFSQKGSGKLYLTTDFIPQHLRLIYQAYNDRIVDYYLDNKLSNRKPKLITF